jgi:hypothetical protein
MSSLIAMSSLPWYIFYLQSLSLAENAMSEKNFAHQTKKLVGGGKKQSRGINAYDIHEAYFR